MCILGTFTTCFTLNGVVRQNFLVLFTVGTLAVESLRFDYGEKNYGRLYPKLRRAHASGVSSEAILPWSSRSIRAFLVLSVVISTKVNSRFSHIKFVPLYYCTSILRLFLLENAVFMSFCIVFSYFNQNVKRHHMLQKYIKKPNVCTADD